MKTKKVRILRSYFWLILIIIILIIAKGFGFCSKVPKEVDTEYKAAHYDMSWERIIIPENCSISKLMAALEVYWSIRERFGFN